MRSLGDAAGHKYRKADVTASLFEVDFEILVLRTKPSEVVYDPLAQVFVTMANFFRSGR